MSVNLTDTHTPLQSLYRTLRTAYQVQKAPLRRAVVAHTVTTLILVVLSTVSAALVSAGVGGTILFVTTVLLTVTSGVCAAFEFGKRSAKIKQQMASIARVALTIRTVNTPTPEVETTLYNSAIAVLGEAIEDGDTVLPLFTDPQRTPQRQSPGTHNLDNL